MLKVLNTDRCLDNFVTNNFVVDRDGKSYLCVENFVSKNKGYLSYSPSSILELSIENNKEYKKDVKLELFNVTIEFERMVGHMRFSQIKSVNHIQYFALKVKDIVDIYLFHQTTEELANDFESHEITFLKHVAGVDTNKNNNLICMFNSDCRITDTNPKEKYNQTNFGNRYVLFGNPVPIISSLRYENSFFSFREYLSGLLKISTYKIKNLLSIFFLRKIYQADDEIIEFDYPMPLLEILETYGKDSPWYHKFKKIQPSENTDMVILHNVRNLESNKFCYAPLNEWFSYHLTKINVDKDIFLILSCIETKFMQMKIGVKSEIDYLSVSGSRYRRYEKERTRATKKREFELEIHQQINDCLS
jgi:hypothetical protein